MQRLLQTCLDIALWRKGPQDLPASSTVCWLVALFYIAISFVQVRFMHYPLADGIALVLVDVGVQSAWLALLLVFFARIQRFPQTFTAVLGVGILLSALDLLVSSLLLFARADQDVGLIWALWKFVIMALVIGRILTQALDRGLLTGVAVVLAMFFSNAAVSALVLRQL